MNKKDHVSRRTKYSMSKHISKLQKRSNTRISLHATPSASKRVLLKQRHYVCYERTNSIKEKFESSKRDFKFRLLERGYPQKLVNNIQAEVDFSSRNNALKYKPKTSKNILPFVTTYNPGVPKLKEILMKNWSLITNNPNLARIFPNAPTVAYKKDKSLKDLLVRAKIPPQP